MTQALRTIDIYLLLHALSTLGAIVIFLIRNEHRITKLETKLELLYDEHLRYTANVKATHKINPQKP